MSRSTSAAIVVHAGRRALLQDSLPCLLAQSLPFGRVIVVDNGSRDDSVAFCRTLPGVEIVELERNIGFAGGANEGLRRAFTTRDVGQVALVNNDVHLDPLWHAEAAQVLMSDPACGSVATCLLKADRPHIVDTAGIVWAGPGTANNYLTGQPAPAASMPPAAIFGACAGAALYRRAFFETVGLFDESLFAYQEDVDISLRGRGAGWRCLFAPAARGLHVGFGSNRAFPLGGSYADFYNARNTLSVLVQSLPADEWRGHGSTIVRGELQRAARSVSEGRGLAVLAGLGAALFRLPSRISRRRRQARLSGLAADLEQQRPSDPGWSRVSVALIVRNAERLLPGALVTVPREAELLVADGGSDDGSTVIAAAAGAIVVAQDPVVLAQARGNFDVARNQLTELASREWVFLLDADERVTAAVRVEVSDLVRTRDSVVAYDFPRENLFWGRSVRLLGEDRQLRLMRRGFGRYVGHALHQPPIVDGPIGHATARLLHHNITGWRDVVTRFRRYLPVEAHSRRGPDGLRQGLLAPWRFFHFYYVRQQAWRDGVRGLVVAAVYALYQSTSEWAAGLRNRA